MSGTTQAGADGSWSARPSSRHRNRRIAGPSHRIGDAVAVDIQGDGAQGVARQFADPFNTECERCRRCRFAGGQRRVVEFGVIAPIHVLAYRRIFGGGLEALEDIQLAHCPFGIGSAQNPEQLEVRRGQGWIEADGPLEFLDRAPDIALLLIERP